MLSKSKINEATKVELDSLIENLTLKSYKKILYVDFDQTNSVNIVFDDLKRTASNETTTPAVLQTGLLNIGAGTLKAVQVSANFKDIVDFEISHDGVNWIEIKRNEIEEAIPQEGFYLRIKTSGENEITGSILIFDSLDNY